MVNTNHICMKLGSFSLEGLYFGSNKKNEKNLFSGGHPGKNVMKKFVEKIFFS